MLIPAAVVARTKKFEGSLSHFYQDSKGNVTVGVGHLLLNAEVASKLTLTRRNDGKAASNEEKIVDFQEVSAAEKGHAATWYKKHTKLDLKAGEEDKLLMSDLEQSERYLKVKFPHYAKYPEAAHEALLDIIFNVGPGNLIKRKWPKLFAAIELRNWKEAANHCNRPDVPEERNKEIAALFVKAAESSWVAPYGTPDVQIGASVERVLEIVRTSLSTKESARFFPQGIDYLKLEIQTTSAARVMVELKGPERGASGEEIS